MFEYLIYRPLGFIIEQIYNLVQNYGWAIIIFTVIVKLILLPLNIKSQKAMKKQQKVQPILMELQRKYANDKEKLQQETMKVYKENNISMMGGCLPMLIQFPILIGLYRVIQSPLKYLLGVDFNIAENVQKATDIFEKMKIQFPTAIEKYANYDISQIVSNCQMQLANWSEKVGGEWSIDFNFFGLDLSRNPSEAFGPLFRGDFSDMSTILMLLIPIFAMFTTWFSMWHSQKMNKQPAGADDSAAQMSKSMSMFMPLMTGFFAITLPGGLGIYWIAANIFQIGQQIFLDMLFKNKEDDFVVKVPEKNRKKRKKRR